MFVVVEVEYRAAHMERVVDIRLGGEAALEVVLNAPVTARQIVDGVRNVTGEQLVIEESRPEAARLRLRFVDRQGGAKA